MSEQKIITTNGVELCVEEFGNPGNPGLLLIAGAGSSMDWWDIEFCERLAAGALRVVRYDHRDTGRSTTYPPGKPGYTGADLSADTAALIEALELAPAHIVGLSMGGGIAQDLALHRPELLASLTLMSTSPVSSNSSGEKLPGMVPELADAFDESATPPDWSSEEEVGTYFITSERLFSGTIPVDEDRIRTIVGEMFARQASFASAENHWGVAGKDEPSPPVAGITTPTLVIHGTLDPLFPLAHGEALAREIPGAWLLPIPGMGHQNPPPPTWDAIIPAILAQTASRQPHTEGKPAHAKG